MRRVGTGASVLRATPAVLLTGLLVACGGSESGAASQVAAKVNKEELSVHQVNFVLQQQRVQPGHADAASAQALERLIDQELAVQRAAELRIDRDPQVLQQLEAARRDIIARAYLGRVSEASGKPSAQDVSRYYAEHPALFAQRRVYTLYDVQLRATPEQVAALRSRLPELGSKEALGAYLRDNKLDFTGVDMVRPAEQLPLRSLEGFARLKDGETVLHATPNGAQLVTLVSSRSAPVDEARARPAIEQFLLNENKRQLIADDMKRLRESAKIEYVGRFAERAAKEGGAPEPSVGFASEPAGSNTINNGMGLKQ